MLLIEGILEPPTSNVKHDDRSFQCNSLNSKKYFWFILNISVAESRLYLILKFHLKGIIILITEFKF